MEVTIPEDLSVLTDAELDDLLMQLVAKFDELHDSGSTDLASLTELADGIDAVKSEQVGREEAAAQTAEELAKLNQRVHGGDATDDSPEEPEGEPEGEEAPEEEGDETTDEERELVTASAGKNRKPTAGAIARRAPKPSVPTRVKNPIVITAAADVPGLVNGSHIKITDVAQGMHDRARGLNDGGPRVAVASVNTLKGLDIPLLTEDANHNAQVLKTLVASYLNDAKALVASGGWCAPSIPLFQLFDITDAEGLLDLPTVGQTRGGVLVPSFYDIGDVSGALWTWTEADDIAAADGDPTKPCLKIPCPTWSECRPEAEGLCVTHGNLSDRAWPELTAYFIGIVMDAHLHRLSAAQIAKIVAMAGASLATYDGPSDAAADLLGYLELQATDLRSQFRAARSRVVEVLLPEWILPALRANMAARAGVDFMNVTDSDILGWLATRGIRPQFLSDYQPLHSGTPATDWPTSVKSVMYFAGSIFKVDGGRIDLGVVRDSTLNETNYFTAAWSEQFYCVMNQGPTPRQLTINLDIDGVTACCAAVAAS